jgi:transcriptional regulator with XRE-family HTH domain
MNELSSLESIGELIKEKRKGKGLLQKELAAKCGISWNYLYMIEKNRRNPSVKLSLKLSKKLDIPLARFAIAVRVLSRRDHKRLSSFFEKYRQMMVLFDELSKIDNSRVAEYVNQTLDFLLYVLKNK